jgi:hypothetical protein
MSHKTFTRIASAVFLLIALESLGATSERQSSPLKSRWRGVVSPGRA